MKNKLKIFTLCVFTLIALGFKNEETPLEKLLKQLAKITASYPQEKVHLHLDKPYYTVGEDIWLKAYLVTAEKNEPSLLSAVLYIDLINEKNEIKKKITLAADKGYAAGNISLLDTLASGTYRLRAYTNYMRNYSQDFFFEKFVTIGNVLDIKSVQKIAEKKLDLKIQFFPEGGNLIAGIRSKIGVKAITSDGLGANLSGYIINKNKEKVAEFTTEYAGMGVFALLPQNGEKYTAIVTMSEKETKSFDLPNTMASGQSIAVNTVGENLNIRISSTQDLVDGRDVFVVAQANGIVYASFTSKIDKSILSANIPKSSFPTGIAQLTLFSADSKPISERLIFINHNDELKIDILNKTTNAGIKKKMNLGLVVKDLTGNAIDGNFSVAVTDLGKMPYNEDEEKTILSNLLLTSDLKGFIEKPNYYFNTANVNREKHLDNLLLTQGWSRFVWKDIVDTKEPNITFRPEQSLEITGKATTLGNKPLPNAKVLMFSNTVGYTFMLDTLTDAKGNFVFDRLEIPDTASFIIQTKTIKDNKNINLVLNKEPQVAPKKYIGNSLDISPYVETTKAMYNELNKFNILDKGILLENVNIVGKAPLKPLINIPGSQNATGVADKVITRQMLEFETDILTPFRKVSGVLIKGNMLFNGRVRSFTNNPPMLLIVDGVYINQAENPTFLSTINPKDLEGIEVLTSGYNLVMYGSEGASGVVYITTKNGAGKPAPNTNIARTKNRGFTAIKQFYTPDYDDPKTNQQIQDLRSTIYWNPNMITNEKGQADFNFFNAGLPATYRVTVEGMDAFGNIGRKTYTYEVK
jgi:hypothetical protein